MISKQMHTHAMMLCNQANHSDYSYLVAGLPLTTACCCRCIVDLSPSMSAMVRLRAWGEDVAELAGDGEDEFLPRFRLAGTAPYFLQIGRAHV